MPINGYYELLKSAQRLLLCYKVKLLMFHSKEQRGQLTFEDMVNRSNIKSEIFILERAIRSFKRRTVSG
jgi:hypothetical protein